MRGLSIQSVYSQTLSEMSRPSSPDWMTRRIVWMPGLRLKVCPHDRSTPFRSAASTICSHCSTFKAIGFSDTTCLP